VPFSAYGIVSETVRQLLFSSLAGVYGEGFAGRLSLPWVKQGGIFIVCEKNPLRTHWTAIWSAGTEVEHNWSKLIEMTEKNTNIVTLLVVAGTLLGGLCGYYLPQFSLALGVLGQWFLAALKILIIPALAAGVITGVTSFGELRRTSGVMKTLGLYFAGMTVIAALLAIVAGWLMAPGGQQMGGVGAIGTTAPDTWQSLSGLLSGLIPGNLFQAAVEGKYVGFVLLAVLLGGVLASIGLHGRTIVTFFRGLHEAIPRIVGLVLYAAPIGIFSLVAAAVAGSVVKQAAWSGITGAYASASLIALGVYGLIILPLTVSLFGGRPVWGFFSDLTPAFLTALGTSSKTATFPVTLRCLTERSRLDSRTLATTLPISTVFGFDGTVVMPVVATLVAASAFGITVGVGQILLVGLLAILASIALAGMPMPTLIVAPTLFAMVGLSAGQIAIALAATATVDWLLDRVRAVVNTASDAVACAVVAGASEARGPVMRPQRGRRPDRIERDVEDSGRERFGGRSEGPGDSRRRSGPPSGRRERGRREESGGRFMPPTAGPRPRPDLTERSPFQMKAGRTPSLGIDSEKPPVPVERPTRESERPPRETERPARETERPARDTERPARDREERREPRRGGGGFGDRGPRGRHRGGPERAADTVGRRPVEEPAEESATPRIEIPRNEPQRISPDVAARDLSRVSAQLREPKPIETPVPGPVSHPETADFDDVLGHEEESVTVGRRDVDDELPEFDSEVQDNQEHAFDGHEDHHEDVSQPAETKEERTEATEGESPEASFGRARHFRGATFRKTENAESDIPKNETPKEPAEEAGTHGFTNEDASFGRMKRKRTR
jgi:solute carrier family 1 (neuronal/epithelial high affinity glutamate transporter), member 1